MGIDGQGSDCELLREWERGGPDARLMLVPGMRVWSSHRLPRLGPELPGPEGVWLSRFCVCVRGVQYCCCCCSKCKDG